MVRGGGGESCWGSWRGRRRGGSGIREFGGGVYLVNTHKISHNII